ncbi:MAG: PKD domain-containing protein, partial [Urechidicola sp.]|nr:PKD domain-containing protein [Urechidicola sp.]
MKTLKYFFSAFLIIAAVWSCEDDEMGETGFVDTVVAPANISALFNITQDNTGLVTITPNGEGAVTYSVYFGDGSGFETAVNGDNITHTYAEGIYTVRIVAIGITGLETEFSQEINVSFNAPENLVVSIENDAAISKQVNVVATADFAMVFDVYFGEDPDDEPITAVIGETASFIYQEAGIYTIRVVARGGAIETTEYEEEFEVTAILQPLVSAPEPPSRQEVDYISIFSDAYTDIPDTDYNPDWGQSGQGSSYALFDLDGDEMLNYINLSYQGINIGSAVNASSMETLHIDVWSPNDMSIDIYPLPDGVIPDDERFVTKTLVANEWNSFDIPLSDFTDQGLPIDNLMQFKFTGAPWAEGSVFIDNLYFYKVSSGPSGLEGTWKMAPEAGSLMVGPSPGNGDWWSIDAAGVTERACFYDDTYVFNADGSFSNVLGADTW